MNRVPAIQFEGYRQFEKARAEANDSMMALMIGSRLASHLLAANAGCNAFLPTIYPAVPGISRMNRTVKDSSQLLLGAEKHLAAMAIPYILATFEALVDSSVSLLIQDHNNPPTKSEKKKGLMGLLEYISKTTDVSFDAIYLQLFDLTRSIRNCIVHDGSVPKCSLKNLWSSLSELSQDRWMTTAERPLPLQPNGLEVLSGELVATLAITKYMARQISINLGIKISPITWAAIVLEDFQSNYTKPLPKDATQLRKKVCGWNRMYYQTVGIQIKDIHQEMSNRGL